MAHYREDEVLGAVDGAEKSESDHVPKKQRTGSNAGESGDNHGDQQALLQSFQHLLQHQAYHQQASTKTLQISSKHPPKLSLRQARQEYDAHMHLERRCLLLKSVDTIRPNAMRVWVDVAKKSKVFLWRSTSDMLHVEEAVGTTVAWPTDKALMDSTPGSIGSQRRSSFVTFC